MRDKFLGFIAENGLVEKGDGIIVALSGGADSVSLLHLFNSIKELYNIRLCAAHLNHRIRGDEAERDADFVRELCREQGIELFYEQADIPAIAEKNGESEELCGRNLRYAFFEKLSREHGAKIATAHTMSDNTETVLMHLVRGAGVAGLKGIPVRRGIIIRPLLCFERSDIERYCEENHLRYVTDSTNLETLYTRNKVRLEAIPALKEINPSLDVSIERTSRLMRDVDRYLNKISAEELKACRTAYGYRCEKLLALDQAVLSYALKNILDGVDAPYEFRHIGLLKEALKSGGSVDLGKGFRAVCAQGILRIVCGDFGADEWCVPITEYEGATLITPETSDFCEIINKKFLNNCIPCDIIDSDTAVRYRREKDVFTSADRNVTKTLKKLFNELKIPAELRRHIKVAANGSEILWIEGIGVSKQARDAFDKNKAFYYMKNNEG